LPFSFLRRQESSPAGIEHSSCDRFLTACGGKVTGIAEKYRVRFVWNGLIYYHPYNHSVIQFSERQVPFIAELRKPGASADGAARRHLGSSGRGRTS
jgi:hypothetical protein